MSKSKAKAWPSFESIDDAVKFFDTHDIAAYLDRMPEVHFEVKIQGESLLDCSRGGKLSKEARVGQSRADTRKLLQEALKLPSEARAALAGSLLESLDEAVDPEAEHAWSREIARRIKEIDSGKVKTVPWSEARRRILGR